MCSNQYKLSATVFWPIAEVADAHLPGYKGAGANEAAADDMAGLTAAQKKRRKKK